MTVGQGGLYYRTDRHGHDHGPVGQQELEELARQGSFTRNTEVRRDGTSVWIRLGRFLNIPDSELPEGGSSSVPEWASLIDEFVIDSASTETKGSTATKPAAPKVERWCCRVYGKEVGPMEYPLLRAMAEQGQISPSDRVRRDGEAKWLLADSISGLFDGLARQESKPHAHLGISPQRFSNFVPKKKKKPPAQPAKSNSVTTKPVTKSATSPATKLATPPRTEAAPATPSASPAVAASSPPESSSAAPAHTSAASPPAGPTKPYASFSGSAQSTYQKPSYTPPRPPPRKRSSGRDWSLPLPDLGDFDIKQFALGFVVFVVVVGVWWAVGGLSLIYGLIFE